RAGHGHRQQADRRRQLSFYRRRESRIPAPRTAGRALLQEVAGRGRISLQLLPLGIVARRLPAERTTQASARKSARRGGARIPAREQKRADPKAGGKTDPLSRREHAE